MEYMQYILPGIMVAIASFTQSSSGFGFGILSMSMLPLIMPFKTASILVALTSTFMSLYIVFKFRKNFDFKMFIVPTISATICSYIGVHMLLDLKESVLNIIMGCTLLTLAAYFMFFNKKIKLKANNVTGLIAGSVSGFFGGLFNVGGPPMVAYYLSVTDDKLKYQSTIQAFFAFNTVFVVFMHFINGNVTRQLIPQLISCATGMAIGTGLGLIVLKKISIKGIKKFVYIFMIVAGIYMFIK